MDRRAFLAAMVLLCWGCGQKEEPKEAAAVPKAAPTGIEAPKSASPVIRGQSIAQVRRIGILTAGTSASLPAPFFNALQELGWVEGRNLVIERRTADGQADRVPALAAELVQLRVDAIVTFGAVAGLAAKESETVTIPIMAVTGDPVAFGPHPADPGGNVPGIALVARSLRASVSSSYASYCLVRFASANSWIRTTRTGMQSGPTTSEHSGRSEWNRCS